MSVVMLFPGQGSQRAGMLHELPDHSVIKQTLTEAEDLLQLKIDQLDSEEALQTTDHVQMSLCIAGVAVSRALASEGVLPDLVAGHSAGAFAAAVASGSLSFKDALHLTRLRGQLMMEAYPQGYGMGVITGMTQRQVEQIRLSIHSEEHPVYIANLNAPTQITVAGQWQAIDQLLTTCKSKGAHTAKRLNVSVPSHCPLLSSVSDQLATALHDMEVSRPLIPYAGNYKGRAIRTAEGIIEDLSLNIAHPVRWHDVTTLFYELGARLFLEMPPGQVLSGLASAAFPEARVEALSSSRLDNAVILAKREQGNR